MVSQLWHKRQWRDRLVKSRGGVTWPREVTYDTQVCLHPTCVEPSCLHPYTQPIKHASWPTLNTHIPKVSILYDSRSTYPKFVQGYMNIQSSCMQLMCVTSCVQTFKCIQSPNEAYPLHATPPIRTQPHAHPIHSNPYTHVCSVHTSSSPCGRPPSDLQPHSHQVGLGFPSQTQLYFSLAHIAAINQMSEVTVMQGRAGRGGRAGLGKAGLNAKSGTGLGV